MASLAGNLVKTFVPARVRHGLRAMVNRVRYFGASYECPFCRARLRTFLPFGLHAEVLAREHVVGGGRRSNALCPVCASTDRERLLYLYLKHRTNASTQSMRLLHVAPEGPIRSMLQAQPNIDYLSADLDDEDVMVNMDITRIEFADNSFDAIICNHVLEHIVDDAKAMSELYRVLKRGGWAILQVPISLTLEKTYEDEALTTPAQREQAFGQSDHVRIYAQDYVTRLEQTGFTVARFAWTSESSQFGDQGNRFGLNREECLHVAVKPSA